MELSPEISEAIEAARLEAHGVLDRSFDALRERLTPVPKGPTGLIIFKVPSDEDCSDSRNKTGFNLTREGVEILFRLLDNGAGYNSAGRKMSITQTAVKNRKRDWELAGGQQRKKWFIPYLDTKV